MKTNNTIIAYRTDSLKLEYGATRLADTLCNPEIDEPSVQRYDLNGSDWADTADVIVIVVGTDLDAAAEVKTNANTLPPEGFQIDRYDDRLVVLAGDDTGGMYGLLDVAEQLRMYGSLKDVGNLSREPEVETRAIKFNLPWSPYREGPQNDIHYDVCRDLDFWYEFLDMMAENRFNTLTLWNLHPFSFMIRPKKFPKSCPFTESELQQWTMFWHALFQKASDRGIETYIINWNAIVSPEFADAYDKNDRELVNEYTRECVIQVLEEYDELTGIGVSLTNEHLNDPGVCEWYRDFTPAERQDWLEETILAGVNEVDRPVKLINRSVRTDSIDEMRRVIDSATERLNISEILVPTKFNWSHGHSTTSLELTHDYADGTVDDRLWNPNPTNYDVVWTIRNEDFFVLRWGDHEFIRSHIRENYQHSDYVTGYIIGSEAFIPAKDISHKNHRHQTWQYIFEKQWLFYMLWGRLLYDPETPTERFEAAFERRYMNGIGEQLLTGYTAGSKIPLEIASFHAATWDYALYAEGFLAIQDQLGFDDHVSPFISVDELIYHEPLDPKYVSISDYAEQTVENEWDGDGLTPLELADRIERCSREAIGAVKSVREELGLHRGALECELQDLFAWGRLGLYFAEKLRSGVSLEMFRHSGDETLRNKSLTRLEKAANHWDNLVELTDSHYREHPYAGDWKADLLETMGEEFPYPDEYFPDPSFSWRRFRDQVDRDIRIAERAEAGVFPISDEEYHIN